MNQTWRGKTVALFFCIILTVPQVANAAEQTSRDTWETFFINWSPMLLILGVWIYISRYMGKSPGKWQSSDGADINQRLDRIEQSLGRIEKALEKK